MINHVALVGRVGQDPEVAHFDSGAVKAKFSLAVNRTKEITDWFDVEVWGRQVDFVTQWVKKGSAVTIQGRLDIQSWQDQQGVKREKAVINATNVGFAPTRATTMNA